MTALRVLWVTSEVPDPHGGGGAIRQHELLRRLAQHWSIDLLVAGSLPPGPLASALGEVVEVASAPAPAMGTARVAWEAAVRRRPLYALTARPAVDALGVELRARAHAYDVIVVHHEELLELLADCGAATRVLHLFDLKGERAAQAVPLSSRRRAWFWRGEGRGARSRLRRWLAAADVVVACTEDDAAVLRRSGPEPRPVVVVGNGVDLDRFVPTPAPGRDRVLFLGSLDYEPNVDGIGWFVEEIWPHVTAARATATLTVAGHRPAPAVTALGTVAAVSVVGAVPDAAACMADHDLVVVPVRIGTGSRLKALDAMASGRPTVGTTVGLEGLGLEHLAEPAAIVVDDPAVFASSIVELLADPARAAALAAAGRRHVEATASWDQLAERFQAGIEPAATVGPLDAGVSVVVCTRGRPALLAESLQSIAAAVGPSDELLVVEADGDHAGALLAGLSVRARRLLAARPGKSRQLNEGVGAAANDVIVLTDDDCLVDPRWVAAMAEPFRDPGVGVVFGDVRGLSAVPGRAEPPPLTPGAPPALTWQYANGAAMAVRRSAVLAVGGYDERLGPGAPVHGEEHDLVLRLLEGGWAARIADAPPVRHLEWRQDDETRRNLRVYSRGAGAFVGLAVRRAPRRWSRLALLRAHYQWTLWRGPDGMDWSIGPVTSLEFLRGFVHGLRLRPMRAARPRRGG